MHAFQHDDKDMLDMIEKQIAALEENWGEDDMDQPAPFSPSFSPVQRRDEFLPSRFYQELPSPPSTPRSPPIYPAPSPPQLFYPAFSPPPTSPSPLAIAEWLMAYEDGDSSMEVEAPLSSPTQVTSPDNVLLYDPLEQLL